MQAKLLRVLQEGEFERIGGTQTLKVHVRVIAATNRDLEKAISQEKFREDLFYRLNVFPIRIPPLRERREEISILVKHLVGKYSAMLGKKIDTIASGTLNALKSYHWPGNVRELENVIERAVILSSGPELKLHEWLTRPRQPDTQGGIPTLDELQKSHIRKVLELTGWKVSGDGGAAQILGVKPTTLASRMRKLGIERQKGSGFHG